MEDQLPFESELIARLGWLVRLRWMAVVATAAAVGLAALWFGSDIAVLPLLVVTAAIAVYNLAFSLQVRRLCHETTCRERLERANTLAYLQIAVDLLALAALIHFSGGVENPLAFCFVFHTIMASILLPRWVSYATAGLAAVLLAGVAWLEYGGLLAHYRLPMASGILYRELAYVLLFLLATTGAFLGAAYLTTSISTTLRERDRALMESNLTCELRSEELAQLNEQLTKLDRERTRFLVLATHELRAPINTIYSALDLARSGYASPEKTQEVLARAQQRATELLSLIGDLLDLTKARQETARPEAAQPVQLDQVLRDVVEFMRVEIEQKGINLEVDVPPDLAPVLALPNQVKLVWTNLLSNAVKYTTEGGRVRVYLSQDAKAVTGRVEDTGIGIRVEEQAHVFDEFFRASNARLVSPHGSGVGLATVRRILENWGGRISVQSQPGEGSAFTFVLPRADA